MISLVLAALFFVGIHLFVAGTGLRDRIVGAIGEMPYMGLFSVASLVGIFWLSSAYATAPSILLWNTPHALRPVAAVLMGIAFLFVVIGLTTKSPTATGGESVLESDEPATGILRITRHPFLWGASLWAATHLVMNGDAASLLFFAAFLVLCQAGTSSIDAKRARKTGEPWDRFVAVTSNVPFAAIAQGRNKLVVGELGVWRVAAGIVAWAAVLYYHQAIFGMPALA